MNARDLLTAFGGKLKAQLEQTLEKKVSSIVGRAPAQHPPGAKHTPKEPKAKKPKKVRGPRAVKSPHYANVAAWKRAHDPNRFQF